MCENVFLPGGFNTESKDTRIFFCSLPCNEYLGHSGAFSHFHAPQQAPEKTDCQKYQRSSRLLHLESAAGRRKDQTVGEKFMATPAPASSLEMLSRGRHDALSSALGLVPKAVG